MADKRVYTFGNGLAEGNASMRNLLGGKGANLAEMTSSVSLFLPDLPLQPRFVASTTALAKRRLLSFLRQRFRPQLKTSRH